MTYNVLGGTLNLAQLQEKANAVLSVRLHKKPPRRVHRPGLCSSTLLGC